MQQKSAKSVQASSGNHAVSVASAFTGPLPSPEIIEKYELLVPGSAHGLFEDFHKNSDHSRNMESILVHGSVSKDSRSQWMAYTLVIGMTAAGVACAAFLSLSLGIAVIVSSMPVTVGAFLKNR